MATFVYAPAIRVHIESEKNGIIDVSSDISQWELTRRSNTVSSFNFVLQNAQRKYDGMFRPQDRISVELKRIVWMRVFTGSLNTVPIFSAWPRALPMSASCSLKKLQFWPWDPNADESVNLINRYFAKVNNSSSKGDDGLSQLIGDVLTKVTNWDPHAIHIGDVPNDWFKFAQSTEQAIDAASSMEAVLGPGTTGGGSFGNFLLKPGRYGDHSLDQDQLNNAGSIYSVCAGQAGLSTPVLQDRAALLALMVAGDESSYHNDKGGDGTSVGLFQQIDSWGTAAERNDPQWATLSFLKGRHGHAGLFDKSNWKTGNPGAVCQSVQVSGPGQKDNNAGLNYVAWQKTAQDLVLRFRAQVTTSLAAGAASGSNSGSILGGGSIPSGTGDVTSGSGDAMAKVAYDLSNGQKQHGKIQYSQSLASDPRSDWPKYLDCSQLDRWVLYHVTGSVWPARDTRSQWASAKVKDIPFNIAAYIRGCLMYGTGSGNGTFSSDNQIEHTGVSLGNGSHVAAHDPQEGINISPLPAGLSRGALAPGIDYTASATTEDSRKWLQNKLGKPCKISTAKNLGQIIDVSDGDSGASTLGGDASDPFSQLISASYAQSTPTGDIFGGARLLMNNQPILPWISNLTNSTMRAFCSAPNGDFMAWFPDYFNVWGTAAIMDIALIELQDFTVDWSDQQIVTHEFVLGATNPLLDGSSGAIVDTGSLSLGQIGSMLITEGIATMDFPEIFKAIYGKPASSKFTTDYLARFGGRPNVESFPNIMRGPQEFYMALWMFMKHWASQFNATVPMTFMPELWPGMLIRIKDYNFQAYVTEVTHRGSYGQGGQFVTEAKIIAPGPCDGHPDGLWGILDITEGGIKTSKKKKDASKN